MPVAEDAGRGARARAEDPVAAARDRRRSGPRSTRPAESSVKVTRTGAGFVGARVRERVDRRPSLRVPATIAGSGVATLLLASVVATRSTAGQLVGRRWLRRRSELCVWLDAVVILVTWMNMFATITSMRRLSPRLTSSSTSDRPDSSSRMRRRQPPMRRITASPAAGRRSGSSTRTCCCRAMPLTSAPLVSRLTTPSSARDAGAHQVPARGRSDRVAGVDLVAAVRQRDRHGGVLRELGAEGVGLGGRRIRGCQRMPLSPAARP